MSYLNLLLTTLPDLVVVLGLFVALGFDYTKYKDLGLEKRSSKAATISSITLLLGLAGVLWQYAAICDERDYRTLQDPDAGAVCEPST